MHRPFIGLFLSLLAGLLLGLWMPVLFQLAAFGAALLLVGFFVLRKHSSSYLFIHAAVLLLGWLRADMVLRNPSAHAIHAIVQQERYISIIGVVSDDAVSSQSAATDDTKLWKFPLRIEAVQNIGSWQKADGHVDIYWRGDSHQSPVHYGQRWKLTGRLTTNQNRVLPQTYLTTQTSSSVLLAENQGSKLMNFCIRGRRRCAEILGQGLQHDPNELSFLRAILLGYREEMPSRLYRAFSQTGTLHIVAISGTHVAVMALLFIAVLKTLRMTRPLWILALAPLLLLYTLSTGMAASAVRACIMALLFWSAYLFRRKPDGPTALAIAAILVLFYAPQQTIDAGFLLSFVVVAGLMALYPIIYRRIEKIQIKGDPWQLPHLQPWWQKKLNRGTQQIAKLFSASFAAWIVSTPLTIYYFNLFTPVTILANLIVIPLSFVILLTGCLSLAFGSVWGMAAEIFNHANRVFISLLLSITQGFDAIPFSHFFMKTLPVGFILLFYFLPGLCLLTWPQRRARKMFIFVSALLLLLGLGRYWTYRTIRVHVIPSGSISCAFVDAPRSGDILIDTGPAFSSRALIRYLRTQGVDRLRALIISRPTADAMGGAAELLQTIPVREIWVAQTSARSQLFKDLLQDAAQRGMTIREIKTGEKGMLAGDLVWEVLSSPRDLLVRFTRRSSSVTFMGSMSARIEESLRTQPTELASQVLILGSLGEMENDILPLLAEMRPSYLVFNPQQYGPHIAQLEKVKERWNALGLRSISLDEGGAAIFQFDSANPLTTLGMPDYF